MVRGLESLGGNVCIFGKVPRGYLIQDKGLD